MADMTSFPKNLVYSLKKLNAGFSKTKVKILPDVGSSGTVKSNGIVRYRISGNGIYDFRSLVHYMTSKCIGTSLSPLNVSVHLPRYTSSLIQNISITAGSTVLCSISEYGTLYNALMDMEGGDYSQSSKRCTEMFDPTVRYKTTVGGDSKLTAGKTLNTNDAVIAFKNDGDTGHEVYTCINNFLGFAGSLSCPCIDLTDIGEIYLNIQFAPSSVLWQSNNPSGTTAATWTVQPDFELSSMFLTIDRISFQDPLYYNLKTQQLLSNDGLKIGYYDYYLVAGSAQQKSAGVNMNFNVNSASLDQCIATFRHEKYNVINPLVMYGSLGTGGTGAVSLDEYNANPVAYTNNVVGATGYSYTDLGDGFANSLAFVRPANDLASTQWSINSINVDPYGLTPIEIYQKNLQYLGFMNQDLGSSGVHVGCKSLFHFLKYYFIDICSLENISGDNQMYVSGLDGRAGGINIQYSATFNTANTTKVYPLIWCRSTRILKIKEGRQIVLDPVE